MLKFLPLALILAASAARAECESDGMAAAAILGATPAAIHQNFAGVIERNFETGNADQIIAALSGAELRSLATVYRNAGGTRLAAIMATRVSSYGLAKVSAAFSYEDMGAIPNQVGSVDQSLYELYLDFRTAPIGSLSVMGAIYETVTYASGVLGKSFGAGVIVGTAINTALQTYAPGLYEDIGGTLDGMMTQAETALDAAAEGDVQQSLDNLFGAPVAYTSPGDFNVTADMAANNGVGGC